MVDHGIANEAVKCGEILCQTFSVIMCVNRNHQWLQEAIDSVLNQEDGDFEFLISANDCTDELWDRLEEIPKKDSRVRLFRSNVGQLAFNLNYLVDNAIGEYIVRMDSDDVCETDRIRCLRAAIRNDKPDIIGSSVLLIDNDGRTIGSMQLPENQDAILKQLPYKTVFCHPSVAIKRQFLIAIRGYLGGLSSEDTDLWLRARRAGASMRNLPSALLRYRIHPNQSIGSRQGYAEVAGHWMREFLLKPGIYTGWGLLVSTVKALTFRWLPRHRSYRN